MKTKLRIRAAGHSLTAQLTSSACAEAIAGILPIRARAETWGDEVYFDIGLEAELEAGAAEVVRPGDIGYWPTGRAICLFFGPTPISAPGEIRPASAVNLVGRITDDATVLKDVADGDEIVIEAAD